MDTDFILKYNKELRESSPIIFEGIHIYPVLFKDLDAYETFVQSIVYNPAYYPDAELSALPRLYFITSALKEDPHNVHPLRKLLVSQLQGMLQLVLKDQVFTFVPVSSGQIALAVQTKDKIVKVNAKKFDTIRRIILLQNDTYCEERYIHPDILKWIEQQKENERKRITHDYMETVEDRVEVMMMAFRNPDEHFLDNMTIRRVQRLHEKYLSQEIFNAQIHGSMSGMVKFKEEPVSWAVTKPKQTDFDKYLKELRS